MGQPWLTMVFNDKTDPQTQTYTFDASLLQGVTNLNYDHLYVITTSNTASASEIVINTLRPYLGDKLLQVGAATFGKNVAQSLFTNDAYPQLEFWLTTSYTANSENFYDYYTDGLQPDYVSSEDLTANLGEFGTPADSILAPVFYHLEHGTFPSTGTEESTRSTGNKIIYNPIDHKPKRSQMSIK